LSIAKQRAVGFILAWSLAFLQTGGDFKQAKMVRMPKRKKGSSGVAQRGKGVAKQCMVKRTGKCSQSESERKGC